MAAVPKSRVTVNIFGQEYVLKTTAPPAYVERLAQLVNERMDQAARKDPRLGMTRAAVLTALTLADELMKLQEQHERLLGMLEREWEGKKKA